MSTYRFDHSGGQVRVHLRIESDGSGVLFINVSDVIHLNSTAAELAKWALDGVTREQAESRLIARYGRAQRRVWRRDLDSVYALVERLVGSQTGCATCSVRDLTDNQPAGRSQPELFQMPVMAPYKVDLALTYNCNNDCPHCYNEAERLRLGLMSAGQWKQVIDQLVEVGVPHLIFTGGEATLHPDLPEIIRHADLRGPICGLNTNARRLSHRSYAEELAEAGLNHIQVTLGSHRPEVHDRMMNARCFDQTVRGIEAAMASGMHTITNTTLMQMNAGEIETTIDFLYELGIRTFAVNGMIYSGGGFASGQAIAEEKMAPILIRIRDKAEELGMRFLWYTPTMYCRLSPVELEIGAKRCNAAEYSMCVEPNGDILPCQSYYVAAGNLLRDSWESIWDSELFVGFRDRQLDPAACGLPEMCWECPDLPLCGGGCRIEREAQAGVRVAAGCSSGGCGSCSAGDADSPQVVGVTLPVTARRGTGVFVDR
jgi:radical SAM protein with 4Fe4S-binding SPASM domain